MSENINSEKIEFNLTYFALKLLGKGLYSNPWTAISELIANSLDADASIIYILIDKSYSKKSSIEIFDDGSGMSFDDLKNKYAFIGRDKRLDETISFNKKQTIMGRKGIGKLATLYLSNNYNIYTKFNKKISCWNFNLLNNAENNKPYLQNVECNPRDAYLYNKLEKVKTGTLIKLNDVDLTGVGDETINGIKQILADFFNINTIKNKLYICVKKAANEKVNFEEISKKIAFKNFCALYDNSGSDLKKYLNSKIRIPSSYETVARRGRKIKILDTSDYKVNGIKTYVNSYNGQKYDLKYNLSGWIGIHSSINKSFSNKYNDKSFLLNKAYNPMKLRLYVRNKLAMSDFMIVLKNNQVFEHYIEGEINFDILDDNNLEDISTTNRQGFYEKDERILQLKEILNPIINDLIKYRQFLAEECASEEKSILDKEKKDNEDKNVIIEKQRDDLIKVNETIKIIKKQNANLFNSVNVKDSDFTTKTHLIKTYIQTIQDNIFSLLKICKNNRYIDAISLTSDKILSLISFGAKALFDINSESLKSNIDEFIYQYIDSVLRQQNPNYNFYITNNCTRHHFRTFTPTYLTIIFDNLVSNSIKAKCNNINVKIYDDSSDESIINIVFKDDGIGIKKGIEGDIFDLGISFTHGTGIGLYNAKLCAKKLNGSIIANTNIDIGAEFIIRIRGDK